VNEGKTPPVNDMRDPRQEDHTDFRRMPGYLLRRCHQIGVAIFLDGCKQLELTPLQFGSLAALDRFGPMDQVSLGGVMALDRTTILVVLSKLDRCGLIERRPSDNDKRSRIASITDAGRSLLSKARPLVDDVQERILSPLTARERSRLVELLAKVADGNNDESRAPYRRPR
jgi:DNA-binding MarR family transcriptional regulator